MTDTLDETRRLLLVVALAGVLPPQRSAAHDAHAEHRASASVRIQRSMRAYRAPAVTLTDMHGAAVSLQQVLRADVPVLLNFIFTTCTSVCPVMSATFAEAQRQSSEQGYRLRLVSISIDPEHDSPARLREFAGRHGAAPGWLFLTGRAADIVAVQRAFDAYRGSKMSHAAATYVLLPASEQWVRFDGLTSAVDLIAEVRRTADR